MQLHWLLYLIGYICLPRITLLFIWYFHGGNLWDYHAALYIAGWILMPRMFIGLLVALTTQNYTIGVVLAIMGFFIDISTKYGGVRRMRKKRR